MFLMHMCVLETSRTVLKKHEKFCYAKKLLLNYVQYLHNNDNAAVSCDNAHISAIMNSDFNGASLVERICL